MEGSNDKVFAQRFIKGLFRARRTHIKVRKKDPYKNQEGIHFYENTLYTIENEIYMYMIDHNGTHMLDIGCFNVQTF